MTEAAAIADERHVLRRRFAKAEARVEDKAVGTDTRVQAGGNARLQVSIDFANDVGVVGVLLHGVGHTAHVHEADGGVRVAGKQGEGTVVFEAAHVVDKVYTEFEHGGHDRSFFGVYRDGALPIGDE